MTQPSFRDRIRPLELLGLAAACGVFAGLVTALVTRDWLLSAVVFGIGFILSLVVFAMLALGDYTPPDPPGDKGVLGEDDAHH